MQAASPEKALSPGPLRAFSCREEAQKVTWEVMQELGAWELLPKDFLMSLREHACSLNAALQKDCKAGGL